MPWAISREITSVGPPAENGTTMWIGAVEKSCAAAPAPSPSSAAVAMASRECAVIAFSSQFDAPGGGTSPAHTCLR